MLQSSQSAVMPCSHLSLPQYRPSSLLCALHQDSRALRRGCRGGRKRLHISAASEAATKARGRKGREETAVDSPPAGVSWDHDTRRREAADMQLSRVEREPQSVSDRRRERSTARNSFQATYEKAVNTPDFAPVLQAGGEEVDYAFYCNGEMQWFAVYVAEADIKKANFVSKWLGYGGQKLGPVQKKDGTIEERVIETWVPKKKVKAYSLRTKKMGTRTVAFQDGLIVLFRAVMDNALGEYLKAGLPDTSDMYNDRVARNEGRILGFVNEARGSRITGYTRSMKRMVEKEHIPKPCGEALLEEVRAWVATPETWDRERVYIAEMGYVPEDTAGAWTAEQEAAEAAKAEADVTPEKAAEADKKSPRRQGRQMDEAVRSFAEAMFEKARIEAAALDSGAWNVGAVVNARGHRGGARGVGRGRGRGAGRPPMQEWEARRPRPQQWQVPAPATQRGGWATSSPMEDGFGGSWEEDSNARAWADALGSFPGADDAYAGMDDMPMLAPPGVGGVSDPSWRTSSRPEQQQAPWRPGSPEQQQSGNGTASSGIEQAEDFWRASELSSAAGERAEPAGADVSADISDDDDALLELRRPPPPRPAKTAAAARGGGIAPGRRALGARSLDRDRSRSGRSSSSGWMQREDVPSPGWADGAGHEAGSDDWFDPQEAMAKGQVAEWLLPEQQGLSSDGGWATSAPPAGLTAGSEDLSPAAPTGWSTAAAQGWTDRSAAAAGRFYEQAPPQQQRGGSQSRSGGWAESSSDETWADMAADVGPDSFLSGAGPDAAATGDLSARAGDGWSDNRQAAAQGGSWAASGPDEGVGGATRSSGVGSGRGGLLGQWAQYGMREGLGGSDGEPVRSGDGGMRGRRGRRGGLAAGSEHRTDAKAEAVPQQGTSCGWAESSVGGAPGAQDSSAWGAPDWATAPAEPPSGGAWELDLPGDLPTTGKWGEWNDFMYAAENPPMDAAQVLPRQALAGDEDLFNFRDEMYGEGAATAEETMVSGGTEKAQPARKKTGRPQKDTKAKADGTGPEMRKGQVAEIECVEEGLGWDDIIY